MQIPIISHRGQKKPYTSIPRINWAHPLTRGLISYGYDIGHGPIDLVTGGQRTITSSTNPPFTGVKSSKYGSGFSSVETGAFTGGCICTLPGGTNFDNFVTAAPHSFACGFMLAATPTSFQTLWSLGNVGGQAVGIGFSQVTASDWSFVFGASTFSATSTNASKPKKFQTALGVALTSATTACYVDGVLNVSPAVTTTHAAVVGSKPTFFGVQATTSQFVPGSFIYYGALWSGRALKASDARLLHDDPYCFLIYPEDEMFASLVGVTAFQWYPMNDIGLPEEPIIKPRVEITGY